MEAEITATKGDQVTVKVAGGEVGKGGGGLIWMYLPLAHLENGEEGINPGNESAKIREDRND